MIFDLSSSALPSTSKHQTCFTNHYHLSLYRAKLMYLLICFISKVPLNSSLFKTISHRSTAQKTLLCSFQHASRLTSSLWHTWKGQKHHKKGEKHHSMLWWLTCLGLSQVRTEGICSFYLPQTRRPMRILMSSWQAVVVVYTLTHFILLHFDISALW